MSFTKKDRKIRSNSGKNFPAGIFSEEISRALHREYDDTPAAVKAVAALTGANHRSVKNWFDGKNGPNGESLAALCRTSNHVLEAFLLLAGRDDRATATRVSEVKQVLREALVAIEALEN